MTTEATLTGLGAVGGLVIGAVTLWMTGRRDRQQVAHDDHISEVSELDAIGSLSLQLAEKMDEARMVERHQCDERIEALRADFEARLAVHQAHIEECERRMAEMARGDLDGSPPAA